MGWRKNGSLPLFEISPADFTRAQFACLFCLVLASCLFRFPWLVVIRSITTPLPPPPHSASTSTSKNDNRTNARPISSNCSILLSTVLKTTNRHTTFPIAYLICPRLADRRRGVFHQSGKKSTTIPYLFHLRKTSSLHQPFPLLPQTIHLGISQMPWTTYTNHLLSLSQTRRAND